MRERKWLDRSGVKPKSNLNVTPFVKPNYIPIVEPEIIPIYNPYKHKTGDKVRINGRVVVIPELDADGNAIPE